jgi:hypothetical protein
MFSRRGSPMQQEEPARIRGPQEWLYVLIVGALAAYFIIGLVAWTWMVLVGVPAPDAFTTILAAVAGALAAIVTPLQGPPGRRADR